MIKKRITRSIGPLLGLAIFAIALFVLHRELKEYSYHDVMRSFGELPALHVYTALALTFLSYLVMTGYDSLALRYVRYPLPYRKIAFASFIGYAFSMNIGLSMVAGGSVRYRLYSAWGLSTAEISKVIVFCTLALWLGLFSTSGVILLVEPGAVPSMLPLGFYSLRPLGIVLLAPACGYLLLCALRKRALKIGGWEFSLPSIWVSFSQIAVSSLDYALAGSVLFALLSSQKTLSYPAFLPIFLLAQIAGSLSQIPGGLGVFEALILTLLSPVVPIGSLLGSLLAYRTIYYLLPFAIAVLSLGAHEVFLRKAKVKKTALTLGHWIPTLLPNVLAFTVFIAGAILLFSGVIPTLSRRLTWYSHFISLPMIETSHFLGSLVGVGLLFLARGLQRRLDGAYLLTLFLLGVGIILSMLKGFEYREAIGLLVIFFVLLPCHRHFYRKASLISQRFTPGWIAAITLVLLCSLWLGIFSYKHVAYSKELWWSFTLHGNAPRFLRAMVGGVAVALFLGFASLIGPAAPRVVFPGEAELENVRTIVRRSRGTHAYLALLGDKALLFNENKTAFVTYGIEGRSWVALGDPIGPEREMIELVWRFHDLVDLNNGWLVFYGVSEAISRIYLDLGLTLLKLGEEAHIPLHNFSLETSDRRTLRRIHSKVERKGCVFKVIPPADVPSLLPELRTVSDAWLKMKNTREKKFSLGFFSEEYVKEFPAAIVLRDGRMVAFANLFLGAGKEELSADLMRHLPEAPNGVMDYLFIEIMLWGRQEGYQWFNMGLAPLSGLEDGSSTTFWNHLGSLVFRYGEHFYNFQGLREYKQKFAPIWEPRYLASPGGLSFPRILMNIASLISGGLKGVVSK
jgi:phosphatidylglycerol lysyltransferase